MLIYEFLYCPCIHESAYASVSLHRTKEGAEKAMKKHKASELKKFNKLYKNDPELKKLMKFGQHEDWSIGEQELLD